MNIEAACVFEPLWKTGKIDMLINKQRAADWSAARLLPAADYLKMQRLRSQICDHAAALFKKYDALVAPTASTPAGAVSVPCGFTAANLPLGLQFIGPGFHEAGILRLAYAYEQANAWHDRHPKL